MSGGGPHAAAPAPARITHSFFEFEALASWTCIDFISDLHLSSNAPRTFDAWSRYMAGTRADAVVILGDLFEVWVGDDARASAFEGQCADVICDASSRRQVAFMAGNRDFLLGAAMLGACGLLGLPDPTVLTAWGQRLLLTHGDALCIADLPYQRFRAQVRQPAWQQEFLAKPLADRLAIAGSMRQHSEARRQFDGNTLVDIDVASAVGSMHAAGAASMVHGHTHRPGSEELAAGFKRHVLSDWDLDDPVRPRAEVLRLNRDGLHRLQPESA